MLHRYISDPEFFSMVVQEGRKPARGEEARLMKARAYRVSKIRRSHFEWVCEASKKWRNEGCDETWTFEGKGRVTALGLVLSQPDYFDSDTYDAAMDVLTTVSIGIS